MANSGIIIIIIIIIQEFDGRRKHVPLLNAGQYHDPDRKLLSVCANSQIVTFLDLHV
jgi:hypothetical protein